MQAHLGEVDSSTRLRKPASHGRQPLVRRLSVMAPPPFGVEAITIDDSDSDSDDGFELMGQLQRRPPTYNISDSDSSNGDEDEDDDDDEVQVIDPPPRQAPAPIAAGAMEGVFGANDANFFQANDIFGLDMANPILQDFDWDAFLNPDGEAAPQPVVQAPAQQASQPIVVDEEEPVDESLREDRCVEHVTEMFPDIENDYVRQLYQNGADLRTRMNEKEYLASLIMRILEEPKYPREREKRQELKRKRDETEAEDNVKRWENPSRDLPATSYIAQA